MRRPQETLRQVAYFHEAQRTAAEKAGLEWKHDDLRHLFISYRLAEIQNANGVVLEAGNSPQVIFRNSGELVTPYDARLGFRSCRQSARRPFPCRQLTLLPWLQTVTKQHHDTYQVGVNQWRP
jgi:hypothetical protein